MSRHELMEVLEAREARWQKKCSLYMEGTCVVALTLRMPVKMRLSDAGIYVFERACCAIGDKLNACLEGKYTSRDGPYALWTTAEDALSVKRTLMAFEESTLVGMLSDADVMHGPFEELSRKAAGGSERRCIVCGQKSARECIVQKRHTPEKTETAVNDIIRMIKDQENKTCCI